MGAYAPTGQYYDQKGADKMQSALAKAIALILNKDAELLDILGVTAEMSLQSSIIALLLGVPIGIWLGSCKFPGRAAAEQSIW